MIAPVLTTARLELWRPQATDRDGLFALVAPDAVRRHLGNRPATLADSFARLLRNAGSWALYGYGGFVVRERGSCKIAGICGVFHSWRGFAGFDDVPEVGWIFAEPLWGRGYASEAGTAALAWFDRAQGPQRVVCMIEPANRASLAVAARLDFVAYGQDTFEGDPVVLLQRAPTGSALPGG